MIINVECCRKFLLLFAWACGFFFSLLIIFLIVPFISNLNPKILHKGHDYIWYCFCILPLSFFLLAHGFDRQYGCGARCRLRGVVFAVQFGVVVTHQHTRYVLRLFLFFLSLLFRSYFFVLQNKLFCSESSYLLDGKCCANNGFNVS